jgi:hypothetical protein
MVLSILNAEVDHQVIGLRDSRTSFNQYLNA